ncbi:MAG TPA: 50S ribosomal protein L11 methyltransferase [Anaerolineae bacterium]
MYWLEVSVLTDGEGAEAIAEALRPFAYNDGVVLEQLGDTSDPALDALQEKITVKIYLPQDQDTPAHRRRLEEILYHLGRLYPIPPPAFRKLEEEDWTNAWKAHYHPFRVGNRIWIQPGWLSAGQEASHDVRPDDVVLTLDPGMAFGTGLHPTTQMCLQALEQFVRPGQRVLDVGSGSGILAIAAAKLGATSVLAIDTDEVAVKTAIANARQNNAIDRVTIRPGTLATIRQQNWDVIVVNILAEVIISLLQDDGLLNYLATGGRLILSGIIDQQLPAVESAVAHAGGQVVQRLSVSDWVTLITVTYDERRDWELARFR